VAQLGSLADMMPLLEKALTAIIAAEVAAPLSIFVLQPGFDKPNDLGLDWGYVVLVFWVFAIAWLVGAVLAWSCRKKRMRYIVVQGFLSPLFGFALWCGYSVYLK